ASLQHNDRMRHQASRSPEPPITSTCDQRSVEHPCPLATVPGLPPRTKFHFGPRALAAVAFRSVSARTLASPPQAVCAIVTGVTRRRKGGADEPCRLC